MNINIFERKKYLFSSLISIIAHMLFYGILRYVQNYIVIANLQMPATSYEKKLI